MRLFPVLPLILAALLATGCASTDKDSGKKSASSHPKGKVETEISMEELEVGSGPKPKEGDTVFVHYTGKLKNGTTFDSSYDRGKPFEYKMGDGGIIQGWEDALPEMQAGGKYKIIVPPSKGYGSEKKPNIPPNSTLIFEMELGRIVSKDKKKKKKHDE